VNYQSNQLKSNFYVLKHVVVQKDFPEIVYRINFIVSHLRIFLFILATEIQNIQIGDGDVARNIAIPIWMLFPRTFTCPTLLTTNFKIGMSI